MAQTLYVCLTLHETEDHLCLGDTGIGLDPMTPTCALLTFALMYLHAASSLLCLGGLEAQLA